MNRKMAVIGLFSLIGIAALLSACAHAVIVPVGPPAPRVEVYGAPPQPNLVWMPGYWAHRRGEWVWMPGYWARPPRPHASWVPGHWEQRRRGWVWIEGHWEHR